LLDRNLLYRFGRAVQGDLTLIALQALFLADLQIERAVSESETTVHTFTATDAKIVIDFVLEVRMLD
jgi:hypothetical protein